MNAYIFKRSLGLHFQLQFCTTPTAAVFFLRFNSDVPYKFEQQTVGRALRPRCLCLFLTQVALFHTTRGWTPRLDGTLMIEHELIATWICYPQPVHSIDGPDRYVL